MTVEVGGLLLVVGACIGFLINEDRRITRVEERLRSLGQQMLALPKRRTDPVDDGDK
jgi:hypothetical protein